MSDDIIGALDDTFGELPKMDEKWEMPIETGIHIFGQAIGDKPAQDVDNVKDLKALSKDYVLLTLGPVYVHARIPFSIPLQIATEINREFNWITTQVDLPVFDDMFDWNTYIEGVRKDDWKVFKKNVMSVTVTQRKRNVYWEIENYEIPYKITPDAEPILINAFAPSGNMVRYTVRKALNEKKMLDCLIQPPNLEVCERAKVILRT
jgi:hypothetical protein